MKRSPLARKTALMRGTGQLKRTPMNPVGKKTRKDRAEMAAATPELLIRSGGMCEMIVNGRRCGARAVHRHHVVRRSQGGTNDADNLKHLCEKDHQYVHNNPAWAMEHGYLARAS